jgi:fibronectin-binding autotransporter adhesin
VISNTSAKEGNSGTKVFSFSVGLSGTALYPVTVNFATASGTATAGSDFVAASGTLTFAKGQSLGYVTVSVIGDRTREGNETFYVTLSNPSPNAYLGTSQATGTITNDD